MKKIYPLLSLLALMLFLSSCLKEGSRNYSETSVVYIDSESGIIYGKALLTGRIITSDQMQTMIPGTFETISYSWQEENGTTSIGQTQVDNVVISGETKKVPNTGVRISAPESDKQFGELLALGEPYYANDKKLLGDNWLFQYAYEAKKGEVGTLQFYIEQDNDATPTDVTLVVKLVVSGEPESGSSLTSKTDLIVVNMAPLRSFFESQSRDKRDLKIKVKYDRKGSTDPIVLPMTYLLTVGGQNQ